MNRYINSIFLISGIALASCGNNGTKQTAQTDTTAADTVIKPLYVTEKVMCDTDDPAIWINPADASQSLIVGTDKDEVGALYVFDLKGKIIKDKIVKGLKRPNNVDIAYGLMLNGKPTDIAVVTERMSHKLRIFSLPDMKPVDNGGIPVFEGEDEAAGFRDLMGIAMYTNAKKEIYAVVGRKTGPTTGGYLWQYLLTDDGSGHIKATLKRKFGKYSGKKEIESIAVDNEMGYVYYSDEQFGVRKYYAEPGKGDQELNLFAKEGFKEDHEGISIYKTGDTTGYILVSDQSAGQFKVFDRAGNNAFIKSLHVSTSNSDGSDVVSIPLNADFKHGLFVGMSDDKTFQLYRWEDLAGKDLKVNN
ncbi:phytase [Mucilaginibacter sp. JRF]|uniref:phytase n=1 Tax=Mucilaginibacter sp. JRF TaxID=2780088 RepID=UPI0018825A63|nr:phytase [Mucilaginibacter sp. JRF]MBE9585801.1 phytase [Mucilaginibacter sp. JRF]